MLLLLLELELPFAALKQAAKGLAHAAQCLAGATAAHQAAQCLADTAAAAAHQAAQCLADTAAFATQQAADSLANTASRAAALQQATYGTANAAAATAFAGTLVGIALPLQAAITHSVSLADAMIWGAVSACIQVVAYALARLVSSRISHQITDNVSAAGIFSAGVSISVGLINAAAITP